MTCVHEVPVAVVTTTYPLHILVTVWALDHFELCLLKSVLLVRPGYCSNESHVVGGPTVLIWLPLYSALKTRQINTPTHWKPRAWLLLNRKAIRRFKYMSVETAKYVAFVQETCRGTDILQHQWHVATDCLFTSLWFHRRQLLRFFCFITFVWQGASWMRISPSKHLLICIFRSVN